MSPIEIQNYACNLAFDIVKEVYGGKRLNEVFPIYEMIVEDFYYRQSELLDKELEKFFDSFVDVKDLNLSDNAVLFYVSDAEKEFCKKMERMHSDFNSCKPLREMVSIPITTFKSFTNDVKECKNLTYWHNINGGK